jgi:hypothetical protein
MKKQQPTNGRSWLRMMEHPHLKITAGNLLIPTIIKASTHKRCWFFYWACVKRWLESRVQ